MTAGPASPGGRQLWGLLPEHYRARDNGDLASYVDALGEVLDLLRGIIQQRIADTFPDDPGLQPWVLPYLADLIDPRVVSADETRRRAEIANAAIWRKTKGTLRMVEQIATVLGGFVKIEAVAHGIQSGLRFLSLIVAGIGLLATALLASSGAARPP